MSGAPVTPAASITVVSAVCRADSAAIRTTSERLVGMLSIGGPRREDRRRLLRLAAARNDRIHARRDDRDRDDADRDRPGVESRAHGCGRVRDERIDAAAASCRARRRAVAGARSRRESARHRAHRSPRRPGPLRCRAPWVGAGEGGSPSRCVSPRRPGRGDRRRRRGDRGRRRDRGPALPALRPRARDDVAATRASVHCLRESASAAQDWSTRRL